MSVWDSITGAVSSAVDYGSQKWDELKSAVAEMQASAERLKGAYADMLSLRSSLSPDKQAEADRLSGMYGTVAGYVDSAMSAFRRAVAAVTDSDDSGVNGLGAIPVLALGIIVAAIPVVYFATESINSTTASMTAFVAGERAARAVLESGGSAEQANASRIAAMQAAANAAASGKSPFGKGVTDALKAALPLAVIGGVIYMVVKFAPARREHPRVAFEKRRALRAKQ